MKVVTRGTPPPKYPWVGHYVCYHCNSAIDIEESDKDEVLQWHDDQRDGFSVRVVCPVCEVERSLSRCEGEEHW